MLNNDLVRIGLVILAGILLLQLLNRQSSVPAVAQGKPSDESMENNVSQSQESQVSEQSPEPVANNQQQESESVMPSSSNDSVNAPVQSGASVSDRPKDCFPRDTLSANDLLPQDKYSKWAEVNPEGTGELKDRNFVEAGWHHGVDTVGQSLRNANYQFRSEPANPQVKVGIWNQSTIGPDTNRRPLEIGGY